MSTLCVCWGNLRTTTRVSPGRHCSVWERCIFATAEVRQESGLEAKLEKQWGSRCSSHHDTVGTSGLSSWRAQRDAGLARTRAAPRDPPGVRGHKVNGTVQWWSGSCRGRRGSIIRAVREQEREDDRSTRLRLGVIMYAGRRESDTRRRS
jgi:hypothetical protein